MNDTITIPRTALVSILSPFIGIYPAPDNPLPPGPWDPIIRKAFNQMRYQLEPNLVPWVIGIRNSLDQVSLNPQPLPPRLAYTNALAQEVIASVVNLQDFADTLSLESQSRVGSVAMQRLQLFLDDYCGTPPRRNPFPFPPSPDGVIEGFNPLELVVIGTQFEVAATTLANPELQQALSTVGSQITERGLAQMSG